MACPPAAQRRDDPGAAQIGTNSLDIRVFVFARRVRQRMIDQAPSSASNARRNASRPGELDGESADCVAGQVDPKPRPLRPRGTPPAEECKRPDAGGIFEEIFQRVIERDDVPTAGSPNLEMGRAQGDTRLEAAAAGFLHDPGNERKMNEKISETGDRRDDARPAPIE